NKTSGVIINVFRDENGPQYSTGIGPKSRVPFELEWSDDLVRFLWKLQQKLKGRKLQVRGEHRRKGMMFRGHPNCREQPWRDWAKFSWDEGLLLPGHIWCFVVIDFDRKDAGGNDITFHHGGIEVVKGTYAVIENALYDPRDHKKRKSDLFIPIKKEGLRRRLENEQDGLENPGGVVKTKDLWQRTFYLADVDAITSPLIVIPNIGGKDGLELSRKYLIAGMDPGAQIIPFLPGIWLKPAYTGVYRRIPAIETLLEY
ncbi:MAG: hypothetical protein ACRCSI_02665, partial [Eubacterium aggregans]